MADPIVITCGECKKQLKVPPQAAGKKVRCKACQAIIAVPAVVEAPVESGKYDYDAEVAAAKNPYAVTYASDAPRCPHCAHDIDPPDSIICLNCGYDLVQRGRVERKVVYERTAGDFVMWHLPTLAAFLGIFAIAGGYFYYHYYFPKVVLDEKNAAELLKDRWNYFDIDGVDWTGIIFHWGIELWLVVIGIFAIFRCVRFVYDKLFNRFLPPEKQKKK